jgi:glutamyl-tRNA synthetase
VLGEDGQKLSKRHGAVSVMQYEEAGYLPEAMINFLARLGWAHGDDEVFTREQFVAWFDLDGISPAPSRFNADKLKWVNQEHLKRTNERELGHRLVPYLQRAGLDPASGPDAGAVAKLLRERVATLAEMADAAHYFYIAPHPTPAIAAEFLDAASREALAELAKRFATIEWTREAIGTVIKAAAAAHGLKPAQVMMPMRMLVCGTRETPAIDAVLAVLGLERTRARMKAGLALAA